MAETSSANILERAFPGPDAELRPSVGDMALHDCARRAHEIWLENNSMRILSDEIKVDWEDDEGYPRV